MPKVSNRCKRLSRYGVSPPASVAFMAHPRKVSFEDSHHDSDTEAPSPAPSKPMGLTRKSTMVRPKSSLSLVDLIKSSDVDTNDVSNDTPKMSLTTPGSPVHARSSSLNVVPPSPPNSSRWGQFVDMADYQEEPSDNPSPYHRANAPCSCCTACRRRSSSPYGLYRTSSMRCSLQSRQVSDLYLPTGNFQSKPYSRVPDQAEQLVGALDRLQVD